MSRLEKKKEESLAILAQLQVFLESAVTRTMDNIQKGGEAWVWDCTCKEARADIQLPPEFMSIARFGRPFRVQDTRPSGPIIFNEDGTATVWFNTCPDTWPETTALAVVEPPTPEKRKWWRLGL